MMTLQTDIADAYESLPMWDDAAIPAYQALAHEIQIQYSTLPVTVEYVENDPYQSSKDMFADVDSGHLYVFSGSSEHAFFGSMLNCMFRAIHDYYGHYLGHNQFGPKGEEKAWRQHSAMFSKLAQRALTTETRGQNHWVNYGPYSYLPVKERPFAKQKVALLPEWMCEYEVD